MDISKIGNNAIQNTLDSTKSKVADDSFEKRLQNAVNTQDDKELKKVCKDFESIMMNMMFKEMKSSIPKSDLIPEDSGKEIFDSMLDEKLMDEASKGSGIGLADMLYKQLSKRSKSRETPESKGDTASVEKK